MKQRQKYNTPSVLQWVPVRLEDDLLGVSGWGLTTEIFGQSIEDYFEYDEVNDQWRSTASETPWD